MIQIISKKGSALLITIFILMAMLMASLTGLQAYSKHFTREIARQEIGHVRGYYVAMAGLRYASILLQNPAALNFVGNVYNVTGTEFPDGTDLFHDLGVTATNFQVTITDLNNGSFRVEAVSRH